MSCIVLLFSCFIREVQKFKAQNWHERPISVTLSLRSALASLGGSWSNTAAEDPAIMCVFRQEAGGSGETPEERSNPQLPVPLERVFLCTVPAPQQLHTFP